MNKRLIIILTLLLMIVTCTSCKNNETIKVNEYLTILANKSGISDKEIYDETFIDLRNWGIVDEIDHEKKEDILKYDFLIKTVGRLLEKEENLNVLKEIGFNKNVRLNNNVDKNDAIKIIEMSTSILNNQTFNTYYAYEESDKVKNNEIKYLNDNYYKEDNTIPELEEVFDELIIEDTFTINNEDIEIIPYGNKHTETNYTNNRYNLLAKSHETFEINGFKVVYKVNSSGLNISITKTKDSGLTFYGDININKIQPTIKWHSKKDDVENAYFRLSFNSIEKFGIKNEKYKKYSLDFKDLDASSFMNLLHSLVKEDDDKLETDIPLCRIKIPIEAIPTADIYLDVSLNLSCKGNIELQLKNSHNIGFEFKNNYARFINDHKHDYDLVGQALLRGGLNCDLSLEALNKALMDIKVSGGINSSLNTVINLYDNEGELTKTNTNLAYSTLNDISKGNDKVKICTDINAGLYLDLSFNSSKTLLHKYGLSKTFNIIKKDDKRYGKHTHIENGHIISACTRTSKKTNTINNEEIDSNKIVLDKTSVILKNNDSYTFTYSYLPDNYNENDLIYEIENKDIVTIKNNTVFPLKNGNTRIKIRTKDDKFKTYLNCLVNLDAHNY